MAVRGRPVSSVPPGSVRVADQLSVPVADAAVVEAATAASAAQVPSRPATTTPPSTALARRRVDAVVVSCSGWAGQELVVGADRWVSLKV